ncbi:MAG: family 10 glycosylhydrolase, partial [Oscillospiraceae bacterium]
MKRFIKLFSLMTLLTFCLAALPQSVLAANEKPFRAVWVSTVYNLDYPTAPTANAATLKAEANTVLDNCKKMGMNAIVLQVRPSADAFYPSDIFPWSKYLTGSQMTAPSDGFDPLAYWITEAHNRGMELHAWINPYRVTKNKDAEWNSISPQNPAKLHADWVVQYSDGNYYFNPGIPEVRKLVVDGAVELATNYNIDGIHLDDYFYPGANFGDSATFAQYGLGFSSIDDWRRDNVNKLIQELNTAVHQAKPNISFGVSPAGIWANKKTMAEGSATSGTQTYTGHYADTRKWVKEGWLDYICPQVYWYIGQSNANYQILANWWADTVRGTGVKLYMGIADYKAGNTSKSSPWYGTAAVQDQMALNQTIPEISGEMHFRYEFLLTVPGLQEYYTNIHKNGTPSLLTQMPSKDKQGTWVKLSDNSWKFRNANSSYGCGWKRVDNFWYYFDTQKMTM